MGPSVSPGATPDPVEPARAPGPVGVSGPVAQSAAAHVFVADLARPGLDDGDAHHLTHVLRLVTGQVVTASDGAGRWRSCRFQRAPRADPGASLEPNGPVNVEPRGEPPITVAFTLMKGQRPEWVVQKLTELGVDVILPLISQRCVVRWEPGRADRHLSRLRRVAREAAMQSRRTWLPEVRQVSTFAQLAVTDEAMTRGCLACPGGDAPSLARPLVLVGPEGGWSPDELACGLPAISLGRTVMRAETAALTAGVLLGGLRAGLVSPRR